MACQAKINCLTQLEMDNKAMAELLAASSSGSLTIGNIVIPLKKEFINQNFHHSYDTEDGALVYHFICLIKVTT